MSRHLPYFTGSFPEIVDTATGGKLMYSDFTGEGKSTRNIGLFPGLRNAKGCFCGECTCQEIHHGQKSTAQIFEVSLRWRACRIGRKPPWARRLGFEAQCVLGLATG